MRFEWHFRAGSRWRIGSRCAVLACLWIPSCLLGQEPAGAAAAFEFRHALERLSDSLGVEIVWKGGPWDKTYDWGSRTARDAGEPELEAFTRLLAEELDLYPTSFLRSAEIERIILVQDLWVEMDGINQNLAGQIFGNTELLLSVSYTEKVNHPAKQRRSLHHLLWHHFDTLWGTLWDDPDWAALNPPGFEYGTLTPGGQHDRTSASGVLTTDYPGFLNRYSTGTLPDDKADMFAYMMVAYDYVWDRAQADPVLRAKMSAIKGRLAQFDANMNEAFWVKIDAIDRDPAPFFSSPVPAAVEGSRMPPGQDLSWAQSEGLPGSPDPLQRCPGRLHPGL